MTLSYEAQAKQHAHAVRMRLMGRNEKIVTRTVVIEPAAPVLEQEHGPYAIWSEEMMRVRYPHLKAVVGFNGRTFPALLPKWRVLAEEACLCFGVNLATVLDDDRRKNVVKARNKAFWLCRNVLDMSLSDIGRVFKKDHTSVMHGLKQHEIRVGLCKEVKVRRKSANPPKFKRRRSVPDEGKWKPIVELVCQKYGITVDELIAPGRTTRAAFCRQEAAWLLRRELGMTNRNIASVFKRDHSTIAYGILKHQKIVDRQAAFPTIPTSSPADPCLS